MAAKYQLITELYRRTGVSVAKSPQAWQSFLSSACRNYKCRFDEQLLIYAQRPDAVAVAELGTWNKLFKRWVNKDSKGIAVFDPKGRRNTLKYYFDISDTHEGYYGSRPVPIWQMDERYEQAVKERLSDRFGELEETDLAKTLFKTAENAVEDNLPDYLSQLKGVTQDSFLEELDEYNIEVLYKRLAVNSVAFMLMSRCGLDVKEYFDREDFADIVNFNTPHTINAIGIATSDISEMALREISAAIRNVQMEAREENRTFAPKSQSRYDVGRKQPERSENNERNHIHKAGGLSYSRPNITDRARASAWQIRYDAQGVSGTAQESDLSEPADRGDAKSASLRGGTDGTQTVGASDEAALNGAGRDGGTEGKSPDAVGRIDEQHRYIEGAGCTVIANELENLGYKTKYGSSRWVQSTVIGIIKNEKYKGDLLLGKTFTVDPISKRRLENFGEEDKFYIRDHHEAIISEEIFEEAQKILAKRNVNRGVHQEGQKRNKFSRKYAFSCMIKCGFCGGTLSRRNWHSSSAYTKTIWHCVTATKHGKKNCPHCKGIPEEVIENAFVKSYQLLCSDQHEVVSEFLQKVEDILKDDASLKRLPKIEKEMTDLQRRKEKLLDLRLDNNIDRDIYDKKNQELSEQLKKLQAEQLQLVELSKNQESTKTRIKEFRKNLNSGELLENFDRVVFESVVERIIIGGYNDEGVADPLKITFVYKTGIHSNLNAKDFKPKRKNAAAVHTDAELCSYASVEDDKLCLHSSSDTCGDCGVATKEKYVEILEFTHFVEFFSFRKIGENHKEKSLVKKVTVVVALDLGTGNTKNLEYENE